MSNLYKHPGEMLKETLDRAADLDIDLLYDNCDGTCTTGYDNDGSTGLDIFENGLSLGLTAQDSRLVLYEPDEEDVAFFFIGDDHTIRDRILEVIGEAEAN